VLGNIEIGDGARIGSGSVVVKPVPPGATVVGVPGRLVTPPASRGAAFASMLDHANLPDPVTDMIRTLAAQNERLRQRLEAVESKLAIARVEPSPHYEDPFEIGAEPYPKLTGG
jgi:serine O-acetyltransferase